MNQDINPIIEPAADATPATPVEILAAEIPAAAPAPRAVLADAENELPPAREAAWRAFVAPAWFLLGILVGLGIFAAYAQVTAKPAPPPQTLDAAQIKQAAREGLIEAIQQLQNQNSGSGSQSPQTVDKNALVARDANRKGEANAPVSIVEFADFQCPFCGRHHQAVEPSILQEFVDTGKASYSYKHLAFLGPESVYSAVAAECAADQGKFWQFHDYLFEHQQGENEGAFEKPKLLEFGKALNLDMTRFEKCVNDDETIARVQADSAEAARLGVSSTPTFYVNGVPLIGLKSPAEFRAAVQQALNP